MERGPNDHIAPGAQLDDGLGMTPEELGRSEGEDTGYDRGYSDGQDSVKPLDVVAIARTCYAVNAAYCRIIGDTPRDWDECKDSVVAGVNKALDGATPEQLHDAWCEFQKADGWVLGETKDVVAKTHPCLVQYDQLPAEQRNKDQFFIAVVESLQPLL